MNELQDQTHNEITLDQFDEKEQQQIIDISSSIKTMDDESVMNFGIKSQSSVSSFSKSTLEQARSKDIDNIGDDLRELVVKMDETGKSDIMKKQGFLGKVFKKSKDKLEMSFRKMESVGSQVDSIAAKLKKNKEGLLDDIKLLDTIYEQNKNDYHDLAMHIAAINEKKRHIEQNELTHAKEKAKSGDSMDAHELADVEQFIDRLDRKAYDLELSRQIASQSAPQIRMMQNANKALSEKIQSSLLTSIPLWKNQLSIAISLKRQESAVEAQKQISDMTNKLLVENSEMLKQNAINTAKENERGIVDVETLRQSTDNIMETIDETLKIQNEGQEARQKAKEELQQITNTMQARLTDSGGQ